MTSRRLRVLVISESQSVWGAERSLLSLASKSEASEVNMEFLLGVGSPFAEHISNQGLKARTHRFASHPVLARSGSLRHSSALNFLGELMSVLGGAYRLRKELRGYDCVLIFSLWQGPETVLAARSLRIPVAIDLHETFGNAAAFRVVRLLASISRFVVSPSRVLLERSGIDVNGSNVAVVPRPASVELHPKRVPSTGTLNVGIVGQIEPHKRVLEVCTEILVRCQGIKLRVIGGTAAVEDRSDYERSVRLMAEDYSDRLVVVDFTHDVSSELQKCDVVLNASLHEAFGRTIIEAAATGAYPIAVGSWGPAEVIGDLGFGAVLDSLDQVPTLLERLYAQPDLLTFDVERLRKNMRKYSDSVVAQDYFRLLKAHFPFGDKAKA